VIGLREGLEAALIVGIVAAFLRQQRQRAARRYVWIGVVIAVVVCTAVGVLLQALDQELPQRQQEQLETVVGLCAVAIVTFMIVWMRRHAAGMRVELERSAAAAVAQGSVFALVGMAFVAVLREGLETAVFLLAAFQAAENELTAGLGALLGILTAVAVGAALYRGGIRINLARFFRVTSVFLVIIAAGLLASAAHTAHEAAWLNGFQGQGLDLSWLVVPGTVTSSLLGMLGLQPLPTQAEVTVYLLYAVPMLAFVLWPSAKRGAARESHDGSRIDSGGHLMSVGMRTVALCVSAMAAAGLAGCGSSGGEPGAKKVAVTLVDAGCTPSQISVPAGASALGRGERQDRPVALDTRGEGRDRRSRRATLGPATRAHARRDPGSPPAVAAAAGRAGPERRHSARAGCRRGPGRHPG
jgi:high-affinity iron transporter